MLGDEGYRGDARKFADQVPQGFDLLRCTAMNGYQHGIDRPLAYDAHGIRDGISMDRRKTAAASGINPRALDW